VPRRCELPKFRAPKRRETIERTII
jgi:hypothetical protein